MQALGQIFSVLIGLDLIKKPVSAVIGGTKKIFHGAYEVRTPTIILSTFYFCVYQGITHGIGELSEGIKQVRSRAKGTSMCTYKILSLIFNVETWLWSFRGNACVLTDDASQIVSRARARSLHVPLWDSDFGVASSKLDILKRYKLT